MSPPLYAWAVVALLWLSALLNYVDRQVIFSLLPLLESDLKLTAAEMGMLNTSFLWVYGLASPVAGFMGDRLGRKRVIVYSLAGWTVVTLAMGYARNFQDLLIARALLGLTQACYLPAALALVAEYHPAGTRSLATGLHQSGIYAGLVMSGAAGGWMGEHYGWRYPFVLLGALGLVYAAVLAPALREPAQRRETAAAGAPFRAAVGELLAKRAFLLMLTVFCCTAMANWIIYTWLPLYLYQQFKMGLAAAGFSATFYVQAASFAGIVVGGWLADRWSRTQVRGRLWTQALGVGIGAPFLFLVGFTGEVVVLVGALVLFGLGRGFYDCNTMPVLCQVARPRLRATGYGIFNCAGCIIGGVMAAGAGYLKPVIGLGGAIQLAAAVLLFGAFVLTRIRPEMERAAAE